MSKSKPRIVFWDLETTHNIVASFSLYPRSIHYGCILQERFIVSAAWKFAGEKRVHSVSILDDPDRFAKNPADDRHVCKTIRNVLCSADAAVAHYGNKFDWKFLNARLLVNKIKPVSTITKIDTHKMIKELALFNCNRLDYLGDVLGVGNKIETKQKLWLDILKGKVGAVKEMVRYNKGDIELLERVYERVKPYCPTQINHNLFGNEHDKCPSCGSYNIVKNGHRYSKKTKFQRYYCKDCGASPSGIKGKIIA